MTNEFTLGDWWLEECVARLEDKGVCDDEIIEYARSWEGAAIRYGCWLHNEGFDYDEAVKIVFYAVDEAAFDLSKFPICSF